MRVFLDIDCVLADFIRGVADVTGVPYAVLMQNWTPGTYGFGHAVAAAYAAVPMGGGKPLTITATTADRMFWKRIEGRASFWADLHPLPWAADLVRLAHDTDPEYRFLTFGSADRCMHAAVGKHTWITRQGWDADRMHLTRHKWELAKPGRVLIDDHEQNVTEWRRHGGDAILFPTMHNMLFSHATDPMPVVTDQLNVLLHKGAT